MNNISNGKWDYIIRPKRGLFDLRLHEIMEYRDLLFMFVMRDFVTLYKQTILGPFWFVLQPLITMAVFTVIFSKIARIPTDGVPPAVFYLSGIIIWNYFSNCLTKTSGIFVQNASIYGKVYFPRLVIPIARIISGLISFLIQLLLFLVVIAWLYIADNKITMNMYVFMVPVYVVLTGLTGLGAGLIISALTTTYRDLGFLVGFGVQLLMFATPVIYPMSIIPDQYRVFIAWNPVAHIVEGFRYAFLGVGEISLPGMAYTFAFAILLLLTGIILFNRVERNFMDTV